MDVYVCVFCMYICTHVHVVHVQGRTKHEREELSLARTSSATAPIKGSDLPGFGALGVPFKVQTFGASGAQGSKTPATISEDSGNAA